MDPVTMAAVAGLVGAFIGAAAGVVVSIVNNKSQLQQLQAQWAHEEKKAQTESEATKERQTKERLQNIYSNAVRSLAEVSRQRQEAQDAGYLASNLAERVGEAQKWLSMIVTDYYGNRESAEFNDFYKSFVTFSEQDGYGALEHLRRCVLEFAKNDPRLNI